MWILASRCRTISSQGGIHNVWLRGFDARTVAEVFELPGNIIQVMMLAMGYPSEKAKPNAWHFKRMPMEEFVTEL